MPLIARTGSTAWPLRLSSFSLNLLARCAVAALIVPAAVAPAVPDPFAWLHPAVTIDAASRTRIDRGEVVVRVLPAVDAELGILAAARLDADAETLAAWTTAIAQLKKSPYVLMVRRFSDPPAVEDLEGLALDDTDLDAVRECRPGNCDLKLTADDILSLHRAATEPRWKDAVQREFSVWY